MKEKLRTLHKLGSIISATFNEQELFSLISESLIFKLGFTSCLIFLIDQKSEKIFCKTAIGCRAEQVEYFASRIVSEEIINQLVGENKHCLISIAEQPGSEEKKFIVVPIIVKEIINGFIITGSNLCSKRINEQNLEITSILANQTGAAIENVRLYQGLWNSKRELEIRIKNRTSELDIANRKLKKLDKMKSDFISLVSHELRTPLTSIKGYASILMDEKLGNLNPSQKERLAKIGKHSSSLASLVNNLLDVSRIESGKVEMNIEQVSIKEVLDGIVDVLSPQLQEKNLALKIEIPSDISPVWVDRSQLERVFINLLGNAIKFSQEKAKITVSVLDKEDCIQVDISDTGIGIASDDLPKIFDEFYRADNSINKYKKGTGLGLSLVKRIIDVHKGKISVKSSLNRGSTFSFILPKRKCCQKLNKRF